MWEAIETYMERKQPLIIIAGADYGQGSSRDWAAKGVRLAGVEAIVAEGFERIHRTNLIGMGVLPLEFKPGTNRKTLGIDGTETFDVVGERTPRADLTLVIHRKNGETRRGAGDLPPRYRRGSVDLRGRRRAAALRPGLPRVGQGSLRTIMAHVPQIKIPATYMRGGTSKGVFFRLQDLPAGRAGAGRGARRAAAARDRQPRPLRQADRRHGRRHLQHQQDRHPVEEQQARPRRRLPVRPGLDRHRPSSTGAATAATCRPRSARSPSATAWSMPAASRRTASRSCASGRPTSARPSSRMCRSPTARCRKPATSSSTA